MYHTCCGSDTNAQYNKKSIFAEFQDCIFLAKNMKMVIIVVSIAYVIAFVLL